VEGQRGIRPLHWRVARVASMLATLIVAAAVVAPGASATATADLRVAMSSTAAGPLHIGDTFEYDVTVSNHGAADAAGVVLEDDLPVGVEPSPAIPTIPGGSCSIASSQQGGSPPHTSAHCTIATLAAGASAAVTIEVHVTREVVCGTVTNAASVSARNEAPAASGDDKASVSDTVSCPPSLEISLGGPAYAHVGDAVRLRMVVINDGPSDLDAVRVTNGACTGAISLLRDGDGDATLAVGETWRYGCDARLTAAVGARLRARAIASARSAGTRARASASTTVQVLRPALSVRVMPDPVSGSPGETIRYRYVVRNTGDAAIDDVAVLDDRLGPVGHVAQLAPGHSATFTVERVLRADDVWVVNRATASGTDVAGRDVSATDRASVTIVAPTTANGSGRHTGGGTAFTGSDSTVPAAVALALALIGVTALLFGRRLRV
jgi:uncharacterized repeat protein (TIGR01451 family)